MRKVELNLPHEQRLQEQGTVQLGADVPQHEGEYVGVRVWV